MAYIQPNKLLPKTSMVIRPYQCSFISTSGPNILGKLNMSGVEIPYDSQYTTRITLNPGATKQPLLYGFLGTHVTFILLKFTYDETNPLCRIEEEQFVTYYFEDQPSVKRNAGKLLLFTGNSRNKIPQIYLENPSEIKVTVDALVADLEQSNVDLSSAKYVTLDNLYYTNILSDSYISPGHCISGSTQLQIVGMDDYVQLYLDYNDILTIQPRHDNNELKITTVSDAKIILGFLSSFDMYQAHSRISWVIKNPQTRHLTKSYPGPDITPPVFNINPNITPINPNVYSYPYTDGTSVTVRELINYYIDSVEDDRDGQISRSRIYGTLKKLGESQPLEEINKLGVYTLLMSVYDVANNKSSLNFTIIADDQPPILTLKPIAQFTTGFTMTSADMQIPTVGITASDIIRKTVDNVYDVVDGTIPNSQVQILIDDSISGLTPMTIITSPGQYNITYYVEDSAGNSTSKTKVLTYEGFTILEDGDLFVIPPGMLTMDFKFVGEVGDTTTVEISGQTFIVAYSGETIGSGTVIIDTLIWDLGGPNEYNFGTASNGSITVFVNGTLYTINFTGRDSLLFTIKNDGPFVPIFNISETLFVYSYDIGLVQSFEIESNLNWEIDNEYNWIEFSEESGTSDIPISGTTLEKNITGEQRIGSVNIIGSKHGITVVENITIIQNSIPTIVENEEFTFSEDIQLVYMGDEGTTATIILNGVNFLISKNSENKLIWDVGGVDEHEFEVDGESINVNNISGQNYIIIFDTVNEANRPVFTILLD